MAASGKVAFAACITALFGAMCMMALQVGPTARLLPLVIGVPGVLLGCLVTVQEWRSGSSASTSSWPPPPAPVIAASAWIGGFFIAILLLGFNAGAPLMTAAYFHFALRSRLPATLAAAVGCLTVTYGLFEVVFDVSLFQGLLLR